MNPHDSHRVPDVSVILGVGNHEDRVGHRVRALAEHLGRLGLDFEIIAVNDGSADNSVAVLSLLAARMPELRVIGRDHHGRAFARGAIDAQGATLVLMAGGDTSPLSPLAWALGRLGAGRDAVLLRGRYIVARRMAALRVLERASGSFPAFERAFERRARASELCVVGTRPKARPGVLGLVGGALEALRRAA